MILLPSDPRYAAIAALQTMLCVATNPAAHVLGSSVDRVYPTLELAEMRAGFLAELAELFGRIEAQNG